MYLKVPLTCPGQAICVVLLGLHTTEVHMLGPVALVALNGRGGGL
jgi:hypothetical protein